MSSGCYTQRDYDIFNYFKVHIFRLFVVIFFAKTIWLVERFARRNSIFDVAHDEQLIYSVYFSFDELLTISSIILSQWPGTQPLMFFQIAPNFFGHQDVVTMFSPHGRWSLVQQLMITEIVEGIPCAKVCSIRHSVLELQDSSKRKLQIFPS